MKTRTFQSQTRPGVIYRVSIDDLGNPVNCECPGEHFMKRCWHTRTVARRNRHVRTYKRRRRAAKRDA